MKIFDVAVFILTMTMFDRDTNMSGQNQLRPHLVLGVKDETRIRKNPQEGIYHVTIVGLDGKDKVVTFEPATNVEVFVRAIVVFDEKAKQHKYRYAVANGKTAKQAIADFGVEVRSEISDIKKPPDCLFDEMGKKAKEFWENKIWAEWTFVSGTDGVGKIRPGGQEDILSFTSEGLPGIVECYAVGAAKLYEFEYGEAPSSDEYPSTKPLDNCVRGRTIGPVSPPKDYNAVKFTEYLITLLDESINEQWVSNEETKTKLKNMLNDALGAIKDKKSAEWRKILQNFSIVIDQSKQDVAGEAETLFKHNINYALWQK